MSNSLFLQCATSAVRKFLSWAVNFIAVNLVHSTKLAHSFCSAVLSMAIIASMMFFVLFSSIFLSRFSFESIFDSLRE